jgi:hypothetical protein
MSAERTRVAAHAMPTPIAAEAPISANASTLTDSQFAVPNHLQGGTITRHFMINFRGSLSDMADSPSRASWAPTEHSIFQSKTRYAPNATKSHVRQGNLRQALLIGMKVKKIESKCTITPVRLQAHSPKCTITPVRLQAHSPKCTITPVRLQAHSP